jgi:drug/metabolite transporter (DMT)-like permease
MTPAKQPSSQQLRFAFFVTLLGGLLFTLDLPLLRLSQADQWTMVFTRGCFLFVAISIGWLFNRYLLGERTPFVAGRAGILVAVSSTIGNMAYIGAVVNTTAANVVFLIALTPVMAAALARIVLGERVHAFTWTATGMAFLGVGIIAWDGIEIGHTAGNLLALLSAFCSACAFTVIRATGKKVATSLAIGSLSSALIALIFFPSGIDRFARPDGRAGLSSLDVAGAQRPHGRAAGDRAAGERIALPAVGRGEHVLPTRDSADALMGVAAVPGGAAAGDHPRRHHHRPYPRGPQLVEALRHPETCDG